MRKLLPLLLGFLGIAAGLGAGIVLRPETREIVAEDPCGPDPNARLAEVNVPKKSAMSEEGPKEYVKLNNQFVIPVVTHESVTSLVLISLTVEISPGNKETVFSYEPKLRDALLQDMFDHANIGGFEGAFTNSSNMKVLRHTLTATARKVVGPIVSDVLILDIARQEV